MTLKMLGEQYLQGEKQIRERIRVLRGLLPELRGDEHKELESRIRGLYEMALSAGQTGRYLIEYYASGQADRSAVQ